MRDANIGLMLSGDRNVSRVSPAVTPSETVGTSGIRALLERLQASPQFARSQRLKELLGYLCGRAYQDGAAGGVPVRIREEEIARDVFGRTARYDSGQDTLVRVQVSQLRKRLERYFAAEGVSEPQLLLIPQGSYVPVLRPREKPAELLQAPESPGKPSLLLPWLAGLSVVLAAACAFLGFRLLTLERSSETGETVKTFWRQFEGDRQTAVVLADSGLAAVQDAMEAPVSVDEYVRRDWDKRLLSHQSSPEQKSLLRYLLARRYTSLADVQFVKRLYERRLLGERSTIVHAKDTSVRAFHTGNHVLIGSQRAIPWVRLFEDGMTFRLRTNAGDFALSRDGSSAAVVVENRQPHPGEPPSYRSRGSGADGSEAFAILACLPNLSRTGSVLVLAGSEVSGTEAAGNLLTDEQELGALLKRLGPSTGKLPYFEALLRVWHLQNTGRRYEVIALHAH